MDCTLLQELVLRQLHVSANLLPLKQYSIYFYLYYLQKNLKLGNFLDGYLRTSHVV